MPYRKSYNRRTTNRGYNKYRGRSTNQVQNKQIYQLKKRVSAISNRTKPEKIYYSITGGTTIGTTPSVIPLTNFTRADNEIYVNKLYGTIFVDNNASALATTVRIAIVQDKQQVKDTGINQDDVYESTSVMSQLSEKAFGRARILYDKKFQVNSSGKSRDMRTIVLKVKSKIYYNGSLSTDIQKNGLYMMIWSDKSTNLPGYGFDLRLQYYDN